jgi:hypothetical protein
MSTPSSGTTPGAKSADSPSCAEHATNKPVEAPINVERVILIFIIVALVCFIFGMCHQWQELPPDDQAQPIASAAVTTTSASVARVRHHDRQSSRPDDEVLKQVHRAVRFAIQAPKSHVIGHPTFRATGLL